MAGVLSAFTARRTREYAKCTTPWTRRKFARFPKNPRPVREPRPSYTARPCGAAVAARSMVTVVVGAGEAPMPRLRRGALDERRCRARGPWRGLGGGAPGAV